MTRDYSTEIAASTSLARGISISNNIYYIYYAIWIYEYYESIYLYNVHAHTDDMHFWRSSSLSPPWRFLLFLLCSRFKFNRFDSGNLRYVDANDDVAADADANADVVLCRVVLGLGHIIRETAVTFCIQLNSIAGVMVVVVICCRPL